MAAITSQVERQGSLQLYTASIAQQGNLLWRILGVRRSLKEGRKVPRPGLLRYILRASPP